MKNSQNTAINVGLLDTMSQVAQRRVNTEHKSLVQNTAHGYVHRPLLGASVVEMRHQRITQNLGTNALKEGVERRSTDVGPL